MRWKVPVGFDTPVPVTPDMDLIPAYSEAFAFSAALTQGVPDATLLRANQNRAYQIDAVIGKLTTDANVYDRSLLVEITQGVRPAPLVADVIYYSPLFSTTNNEATFVFDSSGTIGRIDSINGCAALYSYIPRLPCAKNSDLYVYADLAATDAMTVYLFGRWLEQ